MSENAVSENVFIGKFGVGKSVSENLVSKNLLSEKSPRPILQGSIYRVYGGKYRVLITGYMVITEDVLGH